MLIAIFISGYLVNKLGVGWDRIASAISCAVIGLLLYLMFTASSVTLFITYQTIVLISFVIVLLPAIVWKQLPTMVTGTAMGMANTGGQAAGFITPMAIGFIVDTFNGSFTAAFWMLIGFAIICILALLTLNNKKGELLVKYADEG